MSGAWSFAGWTAAAAMVFGIAACTVDDAKSNDDDDGSSNTTDGAGGASASGAGGAVAGSGAGTTGGPFATCGDGGPTTEHTLVTLTSGEYLVWAPTPANDPAAPYPLVVALHGDEGHPDQAVSFIWGPVFSARQDFILVAPICPGASSSWWQDDTDSYAVFLDEILNDVAGKYNVDIARAYAIGYSGGSCWLSAYAFQFQDVFAGVQWSCGGCNPNVIAPPRADCTVDGRFHISSDDFLLQGAQATEQAMSSAGHETEFVTAPCSGHCCANSSNYAEEALTWFLGRTKCDSTDGMGCGAITDLP